jgi:hypothetical protein
MDDLERAQRMDQYLYNWEEEHQKRGLPQPVDLPSDPRKKESDNAIDVGG